MITSPEQKELDAVKDDVLVPQSDVGIGTTATAGFAFDEPRMQSVSLAEGLTNRKLKKVLEKTSPVDVEQLNELPEEAPILEGVDNTLVNSFGPLGFDKRLKLDKQETAVWSAAWHRSFPGVTADFIQEQLRTYTPDPNYNVFDDIPVEFLNAENLTNFITSVNSADTADRANKLRQKQLWDYSISESPWQYAGAALLFGIVDPLTYALPGGALRQGAKQILEQGGKALLGKEIALATAKAGAGGAAQEAITEVVRSQTQQVELEEAAYSTLTAGLLASTIGGTALGIIGAKAANNLRKTTASIMASGVDVPATPSYNPNFRLPQGSVGAMQVVGELGTFPHAPLRPEGFLLKTPGLNSITKWGPAGTLINSESPTANFIANDMFIHNYETSAMIKANQPKAVSTQALMDEYAGAFTKAGVEIHKIYREQFNIGSGFAAGMRARLAGAFASGENLNIDNFSRAVSDVMDTGVPHSSSYVMRAAKIAQDTLRVAKEELVAIQKMHPKFLTPEFDNYFTRMWIKQFLIEKPDDFKLLLKGWFNECNTYYKNNLEEIKQFQKPINDAQKTLDIINDEIAKVNKKLSYQKYKIENAQIKSGSKTLSKHTAKLKELEAARGEFTKILEAQKKALYDFIPAKYLTVDGHIPSIKEEFEIDAAVQQTYDRMTGNDVESFMNPIAMGTGKGAPDPMQVRALTMPLDYFTDIKMGDTYRRINAKDYLSRDVFKMLANYERATNAEIVLTKLAHARGYENITDLKRGYKEHLNDDYARLKVGADPSRADKLDKALKRDTAALENTFAIMEMGTPYKSLDSNWMAKFSKNMRDYASTRYLGSAGLAAIGDIFTPVARQGFKNSIGDWIGTVALGLVKNLNKGIAGDKELIRDLGFMMRTEIGMRQRAFINEQDGLLKYTWWKESASFVKDTFANISCMNQISDFGERAAGTLSISRTFRILKKKFENGVYPEADRIRMRQIGISPEMEETLYRMWREGEGASYMGSYYSNYGNWHINTPDRMRAAQEFRSSIITDINLSKLEADVQDLPAMAYHPVFKTLFQFKNWMMAANNRVLISSAQRLSRGDISVVLDLMFLMAGGALTYVLNALAKNPTEMPDLSLDKLAKEGLDRGGIYGIISEPYNMAQKWGILPGNVVSRYQSRGPIETLVGPSIGGISEIAWDIGNIRKGISGEIDYSTKQANDVKHLVVYQNLWYVRYLFDQVFMNTAVELGATDKRR